MAYENFVKYWEDGNEKWREYGFEVGKVAATIRGYFLRKLELETEEKKNYLVLIPLKEKDNENVRTSWYAPQACVSFEDKGWARVGLLLFIEKGKNVWPKKQFLFTLSIKKKNNNWLVRIAEDGAEHVLSESFSENEFQPLWSEFEKLFKTQTLDLLDKWLEG